MEILIVRDHNSECYINFNYPLAAYEWVFNTYFKSGDWDWHCEEWARTNNDNIMLPMLRKAQEGGLNSKRKFVREYGFIADLHFRIEEVIDPNGEES